jgi:hypothetical protein
VEYRLPAGAGAARVGQYGVGGGYLNVDQNHGDGAAGGHQRNGSGYTTLVGTPSPTAAGFEFDAGGKQKGKGAEVAEMQGSAAGVPGPRWAEVDGASPHGPAPHSVPHGVRQAGDSWPFPSSGSGLPRTLEQGYQGNRGEAAWELDGDGVVRELDGAAVRRG